MHHLKHVDTENVSLDFWNRNRSNYLLTSPEEVENEAQKSNLYSYNYFGKKTESQPLRRRPRLSSRKVFLSRENSKERAKELQEKPDMDDDCSHWNSYNERRRMSLDVREKLTGVNQTSFPVKYSGHPELLSKATNRIQSRQIEPDHETYASYISDHCRKNRRGRNSNKTLNISPKDQQLNKDNDQKSRSKDISTEPLCGTKTSRSIILNKTDNFSHTSTAPRYWCTKDDEETTNENEKMLYFPNKAESKSLLNDKSCKKMVRYRNLVDKNSKFNKSKRRRSCGSENERKYFKEGSQLKEGNVLSNYRANKQGNKFSLRETPCYIQSTYNQRQNETKRNRWQSSWKERQENERCSDRNKRKGCYYDFSERRKSETPFPLTAEDILARPPWTCTRWVTDTFPDAMKEPSASKWAYEVYSDTCLRQSSEDLSAESINTKSSDANEGHCVLEASNEKYQKPLLERSDQLKHVLCANTFTLPDSDFSRGMVEGNAVFLGRQTPQMTPHLMTNYTSFGYDQMMVPECNSQSKEICQLYFQPDNCYDSLDAIGKKFNNFVHYTPVNATRMRVPFGIITNNNKEKQEVSSTQQTDSEALATDKRSEINGSENAQIKKSENQNDNGKDEGKLDSQTSDTISSQSQSSIDEKLIRTVHAIKEDIQGVFDRLNSFETSDPAIMKPVLLIQENLLSVLDQAKATESKDVETVNSAAEIVTSAIKKLAGISTAFVSNIIEEENENSNLSYDLYKTGTREYNTGIETHGCDYNIDVYSIDCNRQRRQYVPQILSKRFMEANAIPTCTANSCPKGKYSQEDIYLILKENNEINEIKQTCRSISQQALAENNERSSSTESSDTITLSENKIYPLTTGSGLSINSSNSLLVQKGAESQSSLASNDQTNDVICVPQPATNVVSSPRGIIKKKRKKSLNKRIKNKLLELFEHPFKLYGDKNTEPSKTNSSKGGNNLVQDIEQFLIDKSSAERFQTGECDNNRTKREARCRAENLPKTNLEQKVSSKVEAKSPMSQTGGSLISLDSTVEPANRHWSVVSTPNCIDNTTPIQASISETSGDEKTESVGRRKRLIKKKSEKRKRRKRQYPMTTRDVKIVYKLRSKTSLSESETSLLNAISLSESEEETVTLPANKLKESLQLSPANKLKESLQLSPTNKLKESLQLSPTSSNNDSQYLNEREAYESKIKHRRNYVDARKLSLKDGECFDEMNSPIEKMKSSQRTLSSIKGAHKSTLANSPILNSDKSKCPTKRTDCSDGKKYIQNFEMNADRIQDGDDSLKNSYPIKYAHSSDTNSYPINDVQSSGEKNHPIKKSQRFVKNNFLAKDSQSSGASPGSSVNSIKHFTNKSRFGIRGRKHDRQNIENRVDRDLIGEKKTSDTCSVSSSESSNAKISDLTENTRHRMQNSSKKSNVATTYTDKADSKHMKEMLPNRDQMMFHKSTKNLPNKGKCSPDKQGNESETSSQSHEINEESKGYRGKEIPAVTPNKSCRKILSRMQSNQNGTSVNKDHEIQIPKTEKKDSVSSDKDTSGVISATELNIAITKLYEEINKLRVQLEASTEEISRNSPPHRQLSNFLPFNPCKKDAGKREFSPRDHHVIRDRCTPSFTTNSRESKLSRENLDNDSISDRYFGPVTAAPKVTNRERELTADSDSSAKRNCCVYRKYSAENENVPSQFHVDETRNDIVKLISYMEGASPSCTELEASINYSGNKQHSYRYHSGDEGCRDGNEYWSEDGMSVSTPCDLLRDDAEAGADDDESFDDENDAPFLRVVNFDRPFEIVKTDEGHAQEYILNNAPTQSGNVKAYTSAIFQTADLESKESAAQNNPLSMSQYRLSHESLAGSENTISDLIEGNNSSQGAVKCKIEPSQPDLWPQRFVYAGSDTSSKKCSIYNAVLKSLEESQQRKDSIVNFNTIVKGGNEDNIADKLNDYNFKNKSVFDNLDEEYAKVRKTDLQSVESTKSSDSLTYPSWFASPLLSSTDEYYYTSQQKRQERQSPNEKPASVYMPFQTCAMPMWSESDESPVKKEEDYIPQSHVPRIVQCVKELLFGSAKADVKHSDFDYPSVHARLRSTSELKYSKSHAQKCPDTPGLASNVDGEQNYNKGYVTYLSDSGNGKSNCQNDVSKNAISPELQKYTLKNRDLDDMSRPGASLTKSHAASKTNDRSPCYSERLSPEVENSSCCVQDPSIHQNSKTRSLFLTNSNQHSPLVKEIDKPKTTVQHYSDAINANGSLNLATHDACHSINSNVFTSNEPRSESILSNFRNNENRDSISFEEVNRCFYRDCSLNSEATCLDELDEDTRPYSRVSEDCEEWNGHGTRLQADKPDMEESFEEDLLHHGRNCYVENCSFRQKKREKSLTDVFKIDGIGNNDGEEEIIDENRDRNNDVSGSTLSNYNYVSDGVKSANINRCMFVESSAHNELHEGTDTIGKTLESTNCDVFHENEQYSNSIAENTYHDKCDKQDTHSDKDIEISNVEDETYVDEERQLNGLDENENLSDCHERKSMLENGDETSYNSSCFEICKSDISSRNTTLDEDEIESWYKTTDDESNTQ